MKKWEINMRIQFTRPDGSTHEFTADTWSAAADNLLESDWSEWVSDNLPTVPDVWRRVCGSMVEIESGINQARGSWDIPLN